MCFALCAVMSILVTGQVEASASEEPSSEMPPTPPAVVSREQRALADRVVRAYRDAGYLSFRLEVKAEPYHLIAKCRMAPGKLKTTLYAVPPPGSDEEPQLLAMFVFRDGVMKEYRSTWHPPNGPLVFRDVVVEYPTQFIRAGTLSAQWFNDPDGTSTSLLAAESNCLIGSSFRTWIGLTAPMPDHFRKVIETGHVLDAPMEVDGWPCWVVTWQPDRGDYVRRDVFYFDRKTLMLRKWDTLESDKPDPPQLTRLQNFTEIEVRAIQPEDEQLWSFDVPILRRGRDHQHEPILKDESVSTE